MDDFIDIKEEMKYDYKDDKTPSRVLAIGRYKGICFAVCNFHGLHPNGYVEVTGTKYDDKELFNKLDIESRKNFWKFYNDPDKRPGYQKARTEIECHGGVNFCEGYCFGVYEPKIDEIVTRWFIGWNYGHLNDYAPRSSSNGVPTFDSEFGHKWTTKQVVYECKEVIDQIYENKS